MWRKLASPNSAATLMQGLSLDHLPRVALRSGRVPEDHAGPVSIVGRTAMTVRDGNRILAVGVLLLLVCVCAAVLIGFGFFREAAGHRARSGAIPSPAHHAGFTSTCFFLPMDSLITPSAASARVSTSFSSATA